jgi:hypothetical protein
MSMLVRTSIGLLLVTSLLGAVPMAAQRPSPRAVLTLPASGTFAGGGEFRGTISINRFLGRGNEIVAVGFVAGVLSRDSHTVGTAVAGEAAWPVRVSSGGVSVVGGPASAAGRLTRVAWSPRVAPTASLLRVQADTCPVLNVTLGPNTVDLLGFQVALSGVTLDVAGVTGTPLGNLVCEASKLLGNVAGLVSLLNNLLGLLTGLLGGLTGGLGGAAVPLP